MEMKMLAAVSVLVVLVCGATGARNSPAADVGEGQMETNMLVLVKQAIDHGPIGKGNAPPSNPLSAPPAKPSKCSSNPSDRCMDYFLGLRKGSDIRIGIMPDARNRTEHVIEAVVYAFVESLLVKKENASELLRVIILTKSSPIYQVAILQGIAGKWLQSQRLSFSVMTTEDEASFHPIHGNISMKATHDLVNLKFSTPAGPLGATEMDDILRRAADIY